MRILFCHWRGWPFGGGEIYVFKLMRALSMSGHRVAFLTMSDPLNKKIEGIHWYEVPPAPGIRGGGRQWRHISSILSKERPDVIHVHESQGFMGPYVLTRMVRQFPIVVTIHFAGVLCLKQERMLKSGNACLHPIGARCIRCCIDFKNLKAMLLKYWWFTVMQNVPCVLVGSRWIREFCLDNGFLPKRTVLFPPYWHKSILKKATPEQSNNILYVGRIKEDKGIFHLLRALIRLEKTPWQLRIIGTGIKSDAVRDFVRGAGMEKRVDMTGFVSHDQVWRHYHQGALLVFPSLFPESFGLSGVEAMNAGLPVVAYDAGGVRDWLKNGKTGILVTKGDEVELADAIDTLLKDRSLRKKMGRAAYLRSEEKYNKSDHLKKMLKIYSQVL